MRIPDIWIVSDARSDDALEPALKRMPRGSGLIFRHYHLPDAERRLRFDALARIARKQGHAAVLSGSAKQAKAWGADGAYGPARMIGCGPALLRLVTVHSLKEIAQAHRARADAILLSPVFPTRSHPGAAALGPVRFWLLARHAQVPVVALGGMNPHRAKCLSARKWAAIDSFCDKATRQNPKDS